MMDSEIFLCETVSWPSVDWFVNKNRGKKGDRWIGISGLFVRGIQRVYGEALSVKKRRRRLPGAEKHHS